jgi:DHA1 family multidrug resistance protein-like MFS transporter
MNSKRQLWTLVFVLFVVMLGYGIIIPILPFYIKDMGAGGLEMGVLTASYAAMRLICGPIWGSLSDRVGRKRILLIGILGYAITMVWFGLATELWMLFAARILSGVLSSATAPTAMAYIGDSTTDTERSSGMGLLGAAGGIGTIVGPVLGGLLGDLALSTPFFIAAGLALLSLLLAALFLPESLPAETRRESQEQHTIIDLYAWRQAILSPLGVFFVLTFLSICGLMIFINIFGLYALERFGYGTKEVGWIMMALGLASAIGQGTLVGPLTRRWGNLTVIKVSLLATIAGFGFMVLAGTFVTVLLASAFFGLVISLQIPALTSLTSQRATVSQGVAMGLSEAFVSLGRIVGPLLGGVTFDMNINLPYLIGAAVLFIGFLVSLVGVSPEGTEAKALRPA